MPSEETVSSQDLTMSSQDVTMSQDMTMSQMAPVLSEADFLAATKVMQDFVGSASPETIGTLTFNVLKSHILEQVGIDVSARKDKKRFKTLATELITDRIQQLENEEVEHATEEATTSKEEEQALAQQTDEIADILGDSDSDADNVVELSSASSSSDGSSDESSSSSSSEEDEAPAKKKPARKTVQRKQAMAQKKKAVVQRKQAAVANAPSPSSVNKRKASGSDSSDLSSDSSDSSDSSESEDESESEVDSDEDYVDPAAKNKRRKVDLVPSMLDSRVHDLLEQACTKGAIRQALSQINCNTRVGKITRIHIKAAFTILRQLQDVITGLTYEGKDAELEKLSKDFFNGNIKFDNLVCVINSLEAVQTFSEKLRVLTLLEAAYRVVVSTKKTHQNLMRANYVDTKYRVLHCQMKAMDPSSSLYADICTAIKSTHAPVHAGMSIGVKNVFSIDRAGESARFYPFQELPNRRMLWYPVPSKGGLGGILSQGIRTISPDAPTTGHLFGKGIHLFDCGSQALQGTEAPLLLKELAVNPLNQESSKSVFIILCEVACGKEQEMNRPQYMSHALPPNHCVKAMGRFAPSADTSVSGALLSMGPMKEVGNEIVGRQEFNEYIFYDVGQISMKSLVEIEIGFQDEVNVDLGEESTPMTIDETVPLTVEESLPMTNNLETVPLAVEESVPVTIDHESVSMTIDETVPLTAEDSVSMTIDDETVPLTVEESEPMTIDDGTVPL